MSDARDGDDVDAQAEYADDVELQELLTRAAESPTVHRDDDASDDDTDDGGHRDRVHEAADRALNKSADLIQRLRDHDVDDSGVDGRAWVDRLRSGRRLREVIANDGNNADDGADDPTAV